MKIIYHAPEWLGQEGKEKWAELIALLPELPAAHLDALSLLCYSWQIFLTATKGINGNGTFITVGGKVQRNPDIATCNEKWKEIVKLSGYFGLLPEAKSKEAPAPPSAFEALLQDEDNE